LGTLLLFSAATNHLAQAAAFTPKAINTAPLFSEGVPPFQPKAVITGALQITGNYIAPH